MWRVKTGETEAVLAIDGTGRWAGLEGVL